jgi:hypothetical protein
MRCCRDSSTAIQKDLESRHHGNHAVVARFEALMILRPETMNGLNEMRCNLQ